MMSDGSLAGSGAAGGEDGAVPADIRAHKSWFRVIWDFSRPHTIIGSVLSVLSLHLFAVMAPGAAAVNLSALFVAMSCRGLRHTRQHLRHRAQSDYGR